MRSKIESNNWWVFGCVQNINTPTERKMLQKQINLTDKKINGMVYELYDLTDEEIKIIEENV